MKSQIKNKTVSICGITNTNIKRVVGGPISSYLLYWKGQIMSNPNTIISLDT